MTRVDLGRYFEAMLPELPLTVEVWALEYEWAREATAKDRSIFAANIEIAESARRHRAGQEMTMQYIAEESLFGTYANSCLASGNSRRMWLVHRIRFRNRDSLSHRQRQGDYRKITQYDTISFSSVSDN